ncbi:hypothetical protein F2Q68_00033418 [Brassica cretica]|uniref:Uncharacterized protein n=1 Tax=Brassica cretica TaxID=69181 RepID=A0A8S9H7D9_BRACR|nr:hypothetical protein F2Q68_00033418 [Brassica cretica]
MRKILCFAIDRYGECYIDRFWASNIDRYGEDYIDQCAVRIDEQLRDKHTKQRTQVEKEVRRD